MQKFFRHIDTELFFWLVALIYLACINPAEKHFSFCIFNQLGVWCPGCGIGHSISWLLHGNMIQAFQSHWLGIFALVVIIHRIYTLIKNQFHKIQISLTS